MWQHLWTSDLSIFTFTASDDNSYQQQNYQSHVTQKSHVCVIKKDFYMILVKWWWSTIIEVKTQRIKNSSDCLKSINHMIEKKITKTTDQVTK